MADVNHYLIWAYLLLLVSAIAMTSSFNQLMGFQKLIDNGSFIIAFSIIYWRYKESNWPRRASKAFAFWWLVVIVLVFVHIKLGV